jgi:hypothetical protein
LLLSSSCATAARGVHADPAYQAQTPRWSDRIGAQID